MIKVKVVDRGALSKITPSMLCRYLAAHGWAVRDDDAWRRYWRGEDCVIVPRPEWSKYDSMIYEALDRIARFEDQSQLAIYCELVGEPVEVALGIRSGSKAGDAG